MHGPDHPEETCAKMCHAGEKLLVRGMKRRDISVVLILSRFCSHSAL